MTSHTPTPWRACVGIGATEIRGEGHDIDTINGRKWVNNPRVSRVLRADGNEEANAAHVVRCVNAHDELVAALRRLVDRDLTYVCGDATGMSIEDVSFARAALAKAEAA